MNRIDKLFAIFCSSNFLSRKEATYYKRSSKIISKLLLKWHNFSPIKRDCGKHFSNNWINFFMSLPHWIFFPFSETHPGADPDQIASDYGFINIGQIGSLDHHYLFEHPKVHKRSIQKSHDLHFNLTNHPHIKWCEQQKELKRQEPMNYRSVMQTLFTLLTKCIQGRCH